MMMQHAVPDSNGDGFWVQHAVEQFRDARGRYPPTLEAAVAGHPNALVVLDRVGWKNVHYKLDEARGYLLTFLRHGSGCEQPVAQVEDRHTYLAKLRTWQVPMPDTEW